MTRSLTTGNPAILILRFTLPLLAGNVFQQLYIIADTLIVGRTLGIDALAAVGCTSGLTFLIIGFTFGLTAGLAIPTAQRFGSGDRTGVRRSYSHGLMICAAVALTLTAIATPLAKAMLTALQTRPEVLDQATSFASVLFLGLIANVGFNFVCATLRALGNARVPFILFAATTALNVTLDFVYILVCHLGVAGAGLATVTAQAVFGIVGATYIHRRVPELRLVRRDWRLDRATATALARQGFPMAFQMSIIAIGTIALQFALNQISTVAVAAYAAAGKVDQLAMAPFQSLGVTMSTFAAQNYGAREYRRVRRGVLQCTLIALGFAVLIGTINITCGPVLIGAFVSGAAPEVVALGHIYLTVNGLCYTILGVLYVLRTALQGLGNSLVPTIAGCGELLARITGAFVLASAFGFLGVCLSNPLAWLFSTIPLVIAWRRQRRWLVQAERVAAVRPIALLEAAPAQHGATAGTRSNHAGTELPGSRVASVRI